MTNTRIIFDDDFGEQQNWKSESKRKKDLFDDNNDNNNEASLWNENDFSIKKSEYITLGNDKRFTLDNRFMDDKKVKETIITDTNECDLQKEKERQLDILENVLGAPLILKRKKVTTAKEGLMIRYDPTENGHCNYEINPAKVKESAEAGKLENKKKTTKRKLEKHQEIEAPISTEVSKDIYYTVSDTLTESLKQKEEFSLLKAYGKNKDDIVPGVEDYNTVAIENNNKKFRFNFSTENASKYDSSNNGDANEDADAASHADKEIIDKIENDNYANNLFGACYKDTLFFSNDDVRFNEARRFFNTEADSNNGFKNLRRELKMIVRTKIRKNERRHQPWDKKKKIKRF